MILSHEHKFIYIKTMRTGSSSVEIALAQACGPDDVITPARADLQAMRGARGAQNYRLSHPLVPKRPWIKRLLRRPERYYHPSVGFYEHMPGWRIRAYVGEEIWNSYFKFSFERNPWDRQVSWFHYKALRKGKAATFEEFLGHKRIAYIPSFDLYSENGKVNVDFMGRYETLEDDFRRVLDRLCLTGQVTLPRANSTSRQATYQEYYTPETRDIVSEWYKREIEYFGYQF